MAAPRLIPCFSSAARSLANAGKVSTICAGSAFLRLFGDPVCVLDRMPDRLFVPLKRQHLIDKGRKRIGLGGAGRKKRAAKHRQATRHMEHEDPHDLGNRLDAVISSLPAGGRARMKADPKAERD